MDCQAKLPPPVLNIQSSATTGEDHAEDSSKHQGRKRSFPHERGIWSSYVYVDYGEADALVRLQEEWINVLQTYHLFDFQPIDRMHLSLTKTFTIRHHNIAPFVSSLQELVGACQRFRLEFEGVGVYANEERSRTFIGVRIAEVSCVPLNTLVGKLDECLREYKLPPFYTDRSFHISLLWSLGDQREAICKVLPKLTQLFDDTYEEEYCDLSQATRTLSFKCGNKFYRLPLACQK
ncbi:U6 snRNA phosphodiesterase 1 [Anopheles cruzii]|uniref:U6 snRNA phosphodiesterase 1 n=1 Tax=Anopheles cruzii TaxID=68878 RepID=UPI0022EC596A|nr:U6 snRNA phosphodiesterase 1 [Anopheles cruzii]